MVSISMLAMLRPFSLVVSVPLIAAVVSLSDSWFCVRQSGDDREYDCLVRWHTLGYFDSPHEIVQCHIES